MRRIWIGLAAMASAFLALTAAAYHARTHDRSENVAKCLSYDPAGCTALIQSGHETPVNRAIDYFDRGNAYAGKGHNGEAIADFTKEIARKPDYAKAYDNRGWTYHLKGEDAQGPPDAEKAVVLAPTDANCFGTRAEIYERLGLRDKAAADYRTALVLDPHYRTAEDGLKRLGATP